MAKAASISAQNFLNKPSVQDGGLVCAVFGEEAFLKGELRRVLTKLVVGEDDAELSLRVVNGRDVELRDVLDDLATVSLFAAGRRMVWIEEADPFVSKHRALLEDYVERAVHGVLVLSVKTWPSNTRLAKAVIKHGGLTIACKPLDGRQLPAWLKNWASERYDVRLGAPAARLLTDQAGTELGLLDQELAKLAARVSPGGEITDTLIAENVGSWRTQRTWDIIDAALSGDAGPALDQLGRLMAAGEDAHAILPLLAASLRRLGMACRRVEQVERRGERPSLSAALREAGVPPFKIRDAERQLAQLGRDRAGRVYRWLLDADLAIKGPHSARDRARLVLEMLILRLAKVSDPRRAN